jgi:chemotaxis protein MotD
MTATPALPAQQVAAPRVMRSVGSVDQTRSAEPAPEAGGFDALFSRLRGEAGGAGLPAAETGEAESQTQPRRSSRETRSKPLKAEDVLPMELLMTLYAQQQTTAMPQTAPAPMLQGDAVLDGEALPELPLPPIPSATEAAAALLAASKALAPAVSYIAAMAAAETNAAQDAGITDSLATTLPTPPALQPIADPRALNTMPQASIEAALPAGLAEQLAASQPAPQAQNVPQTPRRMPAPPRTDAAASFAALTDPDASQQPAQTAASTPAAVSVPPSPAAPTVMQPPEPPAAAKPADPAAQPRQMPSAQLTDSAAAPAALEDLSMEQIEGAGRRDGPAASPERQRDTPMVVTRQETALPPAGQPPIAHQAAERIIAELQSLDNTAPTDRTQLARQAEAAAPVRTLQIQLQPADLGVLTVKMTLRDQMLDIKLEAVEHRTARILEADREKLTEILRSAGYALDGVTVQISSPEKPVPAFHAMAGQPGGGQAQQGAQSHPGGAQADAQRGQGSQRGNENRSFASGTDGGDHASRPGAADGDLYL